MTSKNEQLALFSGLIANAAANNISLSATVDATTFTGTSNNTNFVGSVSAANVVSNAQLSANLANYTNTTLMNANIAAGTSNNTLYLGGVAANQYITGSSSLYPKELHVDPNGVDAASSGSIVKPYATIQYALAQMNGSGQKLIIHAGTYNEDVVINNDSIDIQGASLSGSGITNIRTLTTNNNVSSIRINNIWTSNLTIAGTNNVYLKDSRANVKFVKTGAGYLEATNFDCESSGVVINGAGQSTFIGGKLVGVVANNASATVTLSNVLSAISVTNLQGTLYVDKSVVVATSNTANAITSSAGTITFISKSNLVTPINTAARVGLVGYYSLGDTFFDKDNSTLTGINLGFRTYFDALGVGAIGMSIGSATINATSYSGTANSALYLNGTAANGYVNTTNLSANLSTVYSNATAYTDNKVANLVNSAPAALDTLLELANALGNDASFATTVTNNIANAYSNAIAKIATSTANNANYFGGLASNTGSAGQVLTSNGTGTPYWTTAQAGVNTSQQYTFSNTITFTGDVVIGNTNLGGNTIYQGTITLPATYVYQNGSVLNNISRDSDIILNTIVYANGIPYNTSTGAYTLTAGITYELEAGLQASAFSDTSSWIVYAFVDASNNSFVTMARGELVSETTIYSQAYNPILKTIYTPTTNQTIKLRVVDSSGTATIQDLGSYVLIKQLSSTVTFAAPSNITASNNGVISANGITSTGLVTGNGIVNTNSPIFSGTGAITSAHFGTMVQFAGNTGYTVSLPDPSTARGAFIPIWLNNNGSGITLTAPSGNIIASWGANTSMGISSSGGCNYYHLMCDGYNWILFGIKTY